MTLSTNKVTEGVMRAAEVFKVVKDVPNKRIIQPTAWLWFDSPESDTGKRYEDADFRSDW